MRAQCSVCQELFGDSDVVMAPQCGHTFHNNCITQWLATKKSCPTCRQTTTSNKLTRIFFDIAFTVEVDSADLQQKMDEMTLELQVLQREMREVRQENVTLKKKANKYCKEKKEAEEKNRDSEIVVNSLQQRVDFLNRQVKTFSTLEEELRSCKEKLKLMENVQNIVNSTHKEVQEMLEQYGDHSETARSLSTQCVILSRELNAKIELKQRAEEELRKCRRHLSSLRIELQQAKKELKEKEEHASLAEEDVKRYMAENTKLQEKLRVLSDSISSPSGDPRNSALNRLLHESPAPLQLRLSNALVSTPSEPATPPLLGRVKSRVAGLSGLTQTSRSLAQLQPRLSNPETEDIELENVEKKKARKFDLVSEVETDPEDHKLKRMRVNAASTSSGLFYDGFGGHSKPDLFPRKLSSSQPSLTKRKGPVVIKVNGKTKTTTIDSFFSQ